MTLAGDEHFAREALCRFGLDGYGAVVRRWSSGLSGASVWQCTIGERALALKRWPDATQSERIDWIHQVIAAAANELEFIPPLVCDPQGRSRVSIGTHHLELTRWMPGDPICESASEDQMLAAITRGAEAIAHFHRVTQRCGRFECGTQSPAPAIQRRIAHLDSLGADGRLQRAIRHAVNASPTLARAADWLREKGAKRTGTLAEELRTWAKVPLAVQPVLRDIHREHILFCAGVVTGMVDFDAVSRDTVSTDMARWVSGFVGSSIDPNRLWAAAVTGYRQHRPFSACELELAGAIERSSWFIALTNWVIWVADERRVFPGGIAMVDRRVEALLRRVS